MAFTPTLESTLAVMENKGYRVFSGETGFELNIVGVRTQITRANHFDDFMTVFYRTYGEWIFNIFKCTTDPGTYFLENPLSDLGTAILKEGQYPGAYKIGRHRGRYEALVQATPVTVIRDPNRDNTLDTDTGIEETGFFGINIHRASKSHESLEVNQWSAGCQVLADPFQYKLFMDLCREGRRTFGNRFTYTLLNEADFAAV